MTLREMIREHAFPALALISTLSFVGIFFSLLPIAQWTRSQNECIERTFRIDGDNTQGIPAKVWSCNGGGD